MQNVHARVASDLERASGSKSSLKPLPSKRLPVDPIPLPSTKRMKADLEEKPVKVELEEAPATALVKKELLNSEDHPNTIQENPPPNLPADDEPPPNLPADDETKLSKKELIEKHRLTVHPQGWKGKKHPVWCEICSKCFEGRNRARVWQHCDGQEHRFKLRQAMSRPAEESLQIVVKQEPIDHATKSLSKGYCKGLLLGSTLGRGTRLGSDMREVWEEFCSFADLEVLATVCGKACHKIEKLCQERDWRMRHAGCDPNEQTLIHRDDQGSEVCSKCLELPSNQKYLSKVAGFVVDLDAARLLSSLVFDSENHEKLVKAMCEKACYKRRCKVQYDRLMALSVESLHKHVRQVWSGKTAQAMSPALQEFFAHIVRPAIDADPGAGLKGAYLDKLLDFVRADPSTGPQDLEIVKGVVSGRLGRRPVVHGLMAACSIKLDRLERGLQTFRNPKRSSALTLQAFGFVHGWVMIGQDHSNFAMITIYETFVLCRRSSFLGSFSETRFQIIFQAP